MRGVDSCDRLATFRKRPFFSTNQTSYVVSFFGSSFVSPLAAGDTCGVAEGVASGLGVFPPAAGVLELPPHATASSARARSPVPILEVWRIPTIRLPSLFVILTS